MSSSHEILDDSCSKCGHQSSDGQPHFVCPAQCVLCGFIYFGDPADGCPACWAFETFSEMSDDEKMCMKDLFDGS